VKQTVGERACPFNFLYWNFLMEKAPMLRSNQRMAMIYASLGRMEEGRQAAIRDQSAAFLGSLTSDY
jgi:deoxyribodipyrimidine photolyase-related protein